MVVAPPWKFVPRSYILAVSLGPHSKIPGGPLHRAGDPVAETPPDPYFSIWSESPLRLPSLHCCIPPTADIFVLVVAQLNPKQVQSSLVSGGVCPSTTSPFSSICQTLLPSEMATALVLVSPGTV